MSISPNAGKIADPSILVDLPRLITTYYTDKPDVSIPEERVSFGTSGHRGSSLNRSFNEWHILAIVQAICLYRTVNHVDGPCFLGIDTHALSIPTMASAMEVLAANGVSVMLAGDETYTPTPVISHAILTYNKGLKLHFADGIVITPSHNPPEQGGIKYNSINGGPADLIATTWIERKANELLTNKMFGLKRISLDQALNASTTHLYHYLDSYVKDLENVIHMDLIKNSHVKIGVDPLGGAGVHYWPVIAEVYGINLTLVNKKVDPTFSFMTLDWDGQIRMDPSSEYAMHSLIELKDTYDVSFACDTDHDRHGVVAKSCGLLPSNHYLSAAVYYLLKNRPKWHQEAMIAKTVVTSQMINRIVASCGKKTYETPVGFKWFSSGLYDGVFKFSCEESAGASFARLDGSTWTTDKDGIILALLAAEMTAKMEKDPGRIYQEVESHFGKMFFSRVDAKATLAQKTILKNLSAEKMDADQLAGDKILTIQTKAPGNGEPIGGVKVITCNGWFAARPSGTEDIYKIYAESYVSQDHLHRVLGDAQEIIERQFGATS